MEGNFGAVQKNQKSRTTFDQKKDLISFYTHRVNQLKNIFVDVFGDGVDGSFRRGAHCCLLAERTKELF